jgi:hypothetical protein
MIPLSWVWVVQTWDMPQELLRSIQEIASPSIQVALAEPGQRRHLEPVAAQQERHQFQQIQMYERHQLNSTEHLPINSLPMVERVDLPGQVVHRALVVAAALHPLF